jgi:predicted deacylase
MVNASTDAVDIDPKTGSTLGFYMVGRDRPNVLIVSAMHGLSSSCVYASYLIMKKLQSFDRIDGSVTLLPVANPLAFRLETQVSPLDSKDLDTSFPGDEHGTVTERIAWEIWRRASQSDYLIHLKSGWHSCVSHVEALHRDYIHVRNLASQIALPLTIQSSGQRGALITEAAHEGIPAVTIEMRGPRAQVDAQAAVEVREALLNFFRIKGMIPGDAIEASSTFMGRTQRVHVDAEGFFVPTVNLGEVVGTGDVIGKIQDKIDIKCPYDGALVSLTQMKYVFEGDVIARIAAPLLDQWTPQEEEEPPKPRRKW